ncbi:U32 family peptidase [bacterium]|nr:U32 family peptidase [bacterium]
MRKPEILAPVGDYAVLQAALQAGADAVYFGLAEGFNARIRAKNFDLHHLPLIVKEIHAAGAKAYVTLNTLVFESELDKVKDLLQAIQEAKVDALIMQDLGAVRLAKRYAPKVKIHASTQMTLSDIWSVKLAQKWGISRVVVARELSHQEIKDISQTTQCELEVFALGALCVSFSGQCLSSLAWGGRSANRGQCAQPCRLPFRYFALDHGEKVDFTQGEIKLSKPAHLLSPCDLAAFSQVENLIKADVASLKIEGRLKNENYVYWAVKTMREWVDAHFPGKPSAAQVMQLRNNLRDLIITFSRGFTPGFLSHYDHQNFVQKGYPKHRGLLLGVVVDKKGSTVEVDLQADSLEEHNHLDIKPSPVTLNKGMGILFLGSEEAQGGPIFDFKQSKNRLSLRFANPGPDLTKVSRGDLAYLTSSPLLNKVVDQALNSPMRGRIAVNLIIQGQLDQPLTLEASFLGNKLEFHSQSNLTTAKKNPLNSETVIEKLSELYQTPIYIDEVTSQLEPGLFLPLSELKPLKRELVKAITEKIAEIQTDNVDKIGDLHNLAKPRSVHSRPMLSALCRTLEQVRAAVDCGYGLVELEAYRPNHLESMLSYLDKHKNTEWHLVLPRIQKNGEERLIDKFLVTQPRGLLVRSLGALSYLTSLNNHPTLHGDFSLNITNSLSADLFLRSGLDSFTISYDLGEKELGELALGLKKLAKYYPQDSSPVQSCVIPLYRHMPTFHTQHCLYANLLSQGRDRHTCQHPCLKKDLYILDRRQFAHPVVTDYFCRNTIYNQTPLQWQNMFAQISNWGFDKFRIELLNEDYSQSYSILKYYHNLIYKIEKQLNLSIFYITYNKNSIYNV